MDIIQYNAMEKFVGVLDNPLTTTTREVEKNLHIKKQTNKDKAFGS